jgi:endonuclease/exonuclease/phosphatase family metal-dependent hydrolase
MMNLRVVTINVQNNEGDPRRLAIIKSERRRLEPDLVVLQEVLHTPERNQLEEPLEGTGLHGTHQSTAMAYAPPWVERYGGGAVAMRWPHQVVESLDLRGSDALDVPSCPLAAAVPLPREGELLFIVASSPWRLEAKAARERQAVALTDMDARHRRSLPTIIGGDLNAEPDSASVRYLAGHQALGGRSVCDSDAWSVAGEGPGWTWSVDNPECPSSDRPDRPTAKSSTSNRLRAHRLMARSSGRPLPRHLRGARIRPAGGGHLAQRSFRCRR